MIVEYFVYKMTDDENGNVTWEKVDMLTAPTVPMSGTTQERDALTNVAVATLWYNTSTDNLQLYNGSSWSNIGGIL